MWRKIKNILFYHWPIHLINIVLLLLPDCMPVNKVRGTLMKPFFKRCGRNLQVCSNVYFTHIENISVGDNVFIGRNSWIGGYGEVIISDNVMIGPGVLIASANHKYTNETIRFGGYEQSTIQIGKEVWVGGNTSILPGVNIINNTVVAAGSVVNKSNLTPYSLIGGVPAKELKKSI
ncbi:acyltransferase [Senegalia sp. (in: firmicutes)]|uniref:acyltransferase n=1 Tax=Senegalia sp. (in: firmicutes) TaxID=1924098 RepID=UPI003F9E4740